VNPLEILKYLFNSCSPESKKNIDPKLIEILTRPELQHIIPEINKFLIGEKPLKDLKNNWEKMSGSMADHRDGNISQAVLDNKMEGLRLIQEEIWGRCTKDAIIPNNVVRDHKSWVLNQSSGSYR
jgi:hypothetical protein